MSSKIAQFISQSPIRQSRTTSSQSPTKKWKNALGIFSRIIKKRPQKASSFPAPVKTSVRQYDFSKYQDIHLPYKQALFQAWNNSIDTYAQETLEKTIQASFDTHKEEESKRAAQARSQSKEAEGIATPIRSSLQKTSSNRANELAEGNREIPLDDIQKYTNKVRKEISFFSDAELELSILAKTYTLKIKILVLLDEELFVQHQFNEEVDGKFYYILYTPGHYQNFIPKKGEIANKLIDGEIVNNLSDGSCGYYCIDNILKMRDGESIKFPGTEDEEKEAVAAAMHLRGIAATEIEKNSEYDKQLIETMKNINMLPKNKSIK